MSKIFKSEGIVLRTIKYSETSVILDIYTNLIGLQSFIVSGVRKAKSKMVNVYQPMNILEVVAYRSEEKLSRIKEARLTVPYQRLNQDVLRSSIGIFFIDLVRNVISEKERNVVMFNYIKDQLKRLDEQDAISPMQPLLYCTDLTKLIGFEMHDNYSELNCYFDLSLGSFSSVDKQNHYILNQDLSYCLSQLLKHGFAAKLTKSDRSSLLDEFIKYFKFHIDGFRDLRSLGVLRTLMS